MISDNMSVKIHFLYVRGVINLGAKSTMKKFIKYYTILRYTMRDTSLVEYRVNFKFYFKNQTRE